MFLLLFEIIAVQRQPDECVGVIVLLLAIGCVLRRLRAVARRVPCAASGDDAIAADADTAAVVSIAIDIATSATATVFAASASAASAITASATTTAAAAAAVTAVTACCRNCAGIAQVIVAAAADKCPAATNVRPAAVAADATLRSARQESVPRWALCGATGAWGRQDFREILFEIR